MFLRTYEYLCVYYVLILIFDLYLFSTYKLRLYWFIYNNNSKWAMVRVKPDSFGPTWIFIYFVLAERKTSSSSSGFLPLFAQTMHDRYMDIDLCILNNSFGDFEHYFESLKVCTVKFSLKKNKNDTRSLSESQIDVFLKVAQGFYY